MAFRNIYSYLKKNYMVKQLVRCLGVYRSAELLPQREGGYSVKTPLNYPPHPPAPASRHRARALHIPVDDQLPEHSDTSGNWE